MVKPAATRLIDDEIAKIEAEVTANVAAKSTERVYIAGWGEFSKTESGGWNGPGGFYGPSTPMARDCEEQSKEDSEMLAYYKETIQRHHDFFVFMYRESGGELNWLDVIEYQNAMAREAAGYANHLPENAINYFKVEEEKPKESKA